MKTHHYLLTIWCLVSFNFLASGQVKPFEEDCIRLTISDSIAKLLEDPNSGVWSNSLAAPEGGKYAPFWNDECLEVLIYGGGLRIHEIEYRLVWDGQFYNDTVHVHFYFKDPKYVEGEEQVMIGWKLTKYFSLYEILESTPYEKTFVRMHFHDFTAKYPLNTTIELTKRIKRKN
jgi:hypothetical protein